MPHPLLTKLDHSGYLDEADRAQLIGAITQSRPVPARTDLIREGDRPEFVHLVLSGLACRYKDLSDGQRQIMALLIPGDLCDLHVAILGSMDHSIRTMAPCTVVTVARGVVEELIDNPRIAKALWWVTLVDEAILREWLVNMGQRSVVRQIAHLVCELLLRFQVAGQAQDDAFPLPIIQSELSEVLGISAVHVNRSLQKLRGEALVDWEHGMVRVHDIEALRSFCDFDPNYLHLTHRTGT